MVPALSGGGALKHQSGTPHEYPLLVVKVSHLPLVTLSVLVQHQAKNPNEALPPGILHRSYLFAAVPPRGERRGPGGRRNRN
jgi:hypothetical protein